MKENNPPNNSNENNPPIEIKKTYLKSKPRYEILDGLRGVAAYTIVFYHITEGYNKGPAYQLINHGYLAVDFFYALSGFVIGYAYDDRWNKMSYWDFFKRRLVRLHPMVIMGILMGFSYFFFGTGDRSPTIEKVSPWQFILCFFLGLLMIPAPIAIDIRGWGEEFELNGPAWTLFYEYIANILYAFIIRLTNTIILSILVAFSCFLTLNLALNFNVFNLFKDRPDRIYTVIGGWSVEGGEILIGFTRLFYPFFSGLLLERLKLSVNIPGGFWISSIFLFAILAMPRFGGEESFFNGIYEAVSIIIFFPIILMIGSGSSIMDTGSNKICKFLGDISYPLYITHYPVLYLHYTMINIYPDFPMFNKIMFAIGNVLICTFNAYSCLELYDTPIRKWLTNKYLYKPIKEEIRPSIVKKEIEEGLLGKIEENKKE